MMMTMKNMALWFFPFIFCISACSTYPTEVEEALELSGNNRTELIKVLEHYRKDNALKYKAACFLIANMPYHKSQSYLELPSEYLSYFAKLDSLCQQNLDILLKDSLAMELRDKYALLPPAKETVNLVPDIQLLTSDFLIDNIEQAFSEWYSSPLLKNLSFDEFKEWVLPYRTIDETLDNKHILKKNIYNKLSVNGMNDIRKPIECYKKYVQLCKYLNRKISSEQHIGSYDLLMPSFNMDCSNLSARTCNLFRACGIPVVYEFTPQWPHQDSRHYWCASPDSTGKLQPYSAPYNNLLEDWYFLKDAGKVFQRTFGIVNDSPYFLKNENEIVPSVFDIPTIKDVTDRYHVCSELVLSANLQTANHFAYLSFFNTKGELSPVAWGKIDRRHQRVTYQKVPLNMLFFPSYVANNGELIPFAPPFMLRKDSISGRIIREQPICDVSHTVPMHLLRKYPPKKHLVDSRKNLIGSRILGSNCWEGPYDTLAIIQTAPTPYWQEYALSNTRKYRFYRIHKDSVSIDIAELEFLGKNITGYRTGLPSPLPVLSKDYIPLTDKYLRKIVGEPVCTEPNYYLAYDNNPETFVSWGFTAMEFKRPICITHIHLLPRNAMNIIEPGCRYLLFYYDNNKWNTFGEFKSEYNFLDIDSVPSGTIYWLKNLDKGKEELPFYYINGHQIFINEHL